jgi:hypothetical protein
MSGFSIAGNTNPVAPVRWNPEWGESSGVMCLPTALEVVALTFLRKGDGQLALGGRPKPAVSWSGRGGAFPAADT